MLSVKEIREMQNENEELKVFGLRKKVRNENYRQFFWISSDGLVQKVPSKSVCENRVDEDGRVLVILEDDDYRIALSDMYADRSQAETDAFNWIASRVYQARKTLEQKVPKSAKLASRLKERQDKAFESLKELGEKLQCLGHSLKELLEK